MWRIAQLKDARALNLAGGVVEVRDHLLQPPAEGLTEPQLDHLTRSSAWTWTGPTEAAKPSRTYPPTDAPEEGEGSKGGSVATFSSEAAEPAPKRRGRPRKTPATAAEEQDTAPAPKR